MSRTSRAGKTSAKSAQGADRATFPVRLTMPADDEKVQGFIEAQGSRMLSPAIRQLIHMWVNRFGTTSVFDVLLDEVTLDDLGRSQADAAAVTAAPSVPSAAPVPAQASAPVAEAAPAQAQPAPEPEPVEQQALVEQAVPAQAEPVIPVEAVTQPAQPAARTSGDQIMDMFNGGAS